MRRGWLSVGFGLVALVICGAAGPRAKECFLKEDLRRGINGAAAEGKGVALFLDGDDAETYLDELNREIGSKKFKAESLMLFLRRDGTVALGLVEGIIGCVPGTIPGSLHQRALFLARATRA